MSAEIPSSESFGAKSICLISSPTWAATPSDPLVLNFTSDRATWAYNSGCLASSARNTVQFREVSGIRLPGTSGNIRPHLLNGARPRDDRTDGRLGRQSPDGHINHPQPAFTRKTLDRLDYVKVRGLKALGAFSQPAAFRRCFISAVFTS